MPPFFLAALFKVITVLRPTSVGVREVTIRYRDDVVTAAAPRNPRPGGFAGDTFFSRGSLLVSPWNPGVT